MKYLNKIVLHCPNGYTPELDELVENLIKGGVKFIGVVGKDCSLVENIIDELVVGDGSDENRYILTSSHEGESVGEALAFADNLTSEFEGKSQFIEL
jgi:hypothetical protein